MNEVDLDITQAARDYCFEWPCSVYNKEDLALFFEAGALWHKWQKSGGNKPPIPRALPFDFHVNNEMREL